MKVADLRVLGRATQGVKLIDLRGKDYIASITKVPTEEEEPENLKEETANVEGDSNNIAETDTKE